MLFASSDGNWRVDVYFDILEFCHRIELRGRLEIEEITIPLSDLVLQKLQIVRLTAKDVVDLQMLFLEHEVAAPGQNTIDGGRIASLCSRDWGLWRTLTINLDRLRSITQKTPFLTAAERHTITERVGLIGARISSVRKTARWKLRSLVGDRVIWYEPVEDL
jgi:hypothetical protein